ncbi:hypothetical protein [Streptococcus danieliae]|uniref:hypothetical protein n=1 Tax=Streptococcus danieliae TaxID=747656 RepID=UPI0021CAC626|nr:hypothetical protein [Streptococcus danieliae]MCU0082583.1 hypothetical protein [Streptococcus danieliae]
MDKLTNEQRAHDSALLATKIEASNIRSGKYDKQNPFDIYAIYRNAYSAALKAINNDF